MQQSKSNKANATKQKQQSKSNKAKATKQKQQSKNNKSNKAKATKQKLKLWASAFAYDVKGLVSIQTLCSNLMINESYVKLEGHDHILY